MKWSKSLGQLDEERQCLRKGLVLATQLRRTGNRPPTRRQCLRKGLVLATFGEPSDDAGPPRGNACARAWCLRQVEVGEVDPGEVGRQCLRKGLVLATAVSCRTSQSRGWRCGNACARAWCLRRSIGGGTPENDGRGNACARAWCLRLGGRRFVRRSWLVAMPAQGPCTCDKIEHENDLGYCKW